MVTEYPVSLSITLRPQIIKTAPRVIVSVPGLMQHYELYETQTIDLNFVNNRGFVEIRFINKNYEESSSSQDMAVIIDRLSFFGISDPKFVWAGQYRPDYPEPWYSNQPTPPKSCLTNIDYLGWNGVWRLDFDLPVFTWMHQKLDLGWIYS